MLPRDVISIYFYTRMQERTSIPFTLHALCSHLLFALWTPTYQGWLPPSDITSRAAVAAYTSPIVPAVLTVTRVLESALPSHNTKLWSNDSHVNVLYVLNNSLWFGTEYTGVMRVSLECCPTGPKIAALWPGAKPKAVARRKSPKPQLLRPYTWEDLPSCVVAQLLFFCDHCGLCFSPIQLLTIADRWW